MPVSTPLPDAAVSGQTIRTEAAPAAAAIPTMARRIADLYHLPDGTAAEIEAALTRRLSRYPDRDGGRAAGGVRHYFDILGVLARWAQ